MKLDNVVVRSNNKTVYRDGDKCIKLFDEMYSKADILNEALNQARVEATGLDMPKVIEVTKIDNKWAIISDFIEGDTLESLIKKHPEKIDEYLELFMDLQLKMHSKKCPLLNKWKDKMNRKISASILPATTRYELHMRIEGMPKHDKLCHGDFCPSNIIVGKDGKNYIIDWAHATQGNASADAARTYLMFCLNEEKFAEKYLKLFCRKTDTALQYVQKWMPIVAATQLSKNKPEEKEFLLRWASIMDFE